jgi:DNA-binding MarR family transcriptional regulator
MTPLNETTASTTANTTASTTANTTPNTTPNTLELCLKLARAAAALTRKMDNVLGSVHGLSFGDFTLLLHLSQAPNGRLRRVDLADKVGLTASGVTRSLIPLEKIGLVTREADARDARVGYAVLTSTGQKLLKNALLSAQSLSTEWLEPTPVDSLEGLAQVLGILGK